MEFAKAEIAALEQIDQRDKEKLCDLNELELALVGGGTGAVSLG